MSMQPKSLVEIEIQIFMKNTLVYLMDPHFQQRCWLEGKGPEVSDYEEIYNDFLRDARRLLRQCETNTTYHQKIIDLVLPLKEAYEAYYIAHEEKPLKDILNDPQWHKIQKMAREAYDALAKIGEQP